jgi:ABC-2 type transport system permease protein
VNTAFVSSSVRRTLAEPRFLVFTMALPVLLLVSIGHSAGNIAGTSGAVFYMANLAVYGATAAAINSGARIAIERESGWLRQLRLTPLSSRDYVLGKAVVSQLVALPSILAATVAGLFILQVHTSAWHVVEFVALAWVSLIPFSALGVALGYLANGEAVQALTALVFNVMALAGGTWWDVDADSGTRTVARLLPTYWANRYARAPFTGGSLPFEGVVVLLAWTAAALVLAATRYRADLAKTA